MAGGVFCDDEHDASGARCFLDPGHDNPTHQGWAHYPGQLAVWPNTAPVPG